MGRRQADLGSGWGGMGWSGGEVSWPSQVLPAWGKSWRWGRHRAHRLLRVSASQVSLPASFLLSFCPPHAYIPFHLLSEGEGRQDQFLYWKKRKGCAPPPLGGGGQRDYGGCWEHSVLLGARSQRKPGNRVGVGTGSLQPSQEEGLGHRAWHTVGT